ncbi:MAG: hypothetical protein AAF821_00105 [Cyanobacteria bacterium P01_D01_bin.156]
MTPAGQFPHFRRFRQLPILTRFIFLAPVSHPVAGKCQQACPDRTSSPLSWSYLL